MKADTYTLLQIFGLGTRYAIPLYQRPYVWTEEQQWLPLWEDIRVLTERQLDDSDDNDDVPHFMGAIVVAHMGSKLSEDARLVIDGQQRLTTFQLLMAAIRRLADEHHAPKARLLVAPLLLIDALLVEVPDHRFKLVPTNADRAAFQSVVAEDATVEIRLADGASGRTIDAYRFFLDQVRKWAGDGEEGAITKLDKLAESVTKLVKIVVIDLEPRDNAQAIFETLNARGQPLLAADLVKNDLLQRATANKEPVEGLYREYWHDFDLKHWRQTIGQGRNRRPRIDVFLGHWLTLRSRKEVSPQHLFDQFREYSRSSIGTLSVEAILRDLRTNANVFSGFDYFEVGTPEQLFFYRLGVLEANTAMPVMLHVFGPDGIRDLEDRRRAITAIESWLVRRMLRRLTTKNYNQVFLGLLKRLNDDGPQADVVVAHLAGLSGESQVWPDDEVLRSDLTTLPYYTSITRPRLRMVLEALEVSSHGPLTGPFTPWKALTVEHILPQEWRTHWPLPTDVDEVEAAMVRDAARHRLGNLTLVTQELNASLSNAPWVAQVAGVAPKRESLSKSNTLMLNKPVLEHETWSEPEIAARGRDLAERVIQIWPGPPR